MSNIKLKVNFHSMAKEDHCLLEPSIPMYGVSDGMGGKGHGDLASQLVSQWLAHCIHSTSTGQETTWPFEKKEGLSLEENFLRMAFLQTQQKLIDRAQQEEKLGQMGCSSVILFVHEDKFIFENVGTCMAYLYRKGKLLALTQSNSLGTYKHWEPFRAEYNIPLNFFGKEGLFDIDSHAEHHPKEGDLYLLLSTGFMNSVPLDQLTTEIQKNISNFSSLSKMLVAQANSLNPLQDSTCLCLLVA